MPYDGFHVTPGNSHFVSARGGTLGPERRSETAPSHCRGRRRQWLVNQRQVFGGEFAVPPLLDLIGDLLAFAERTQPGTLYGRDMDEGVFGSVVRFDEAEPACYIEEFHSTYSHRITFISDRNPGHLRAQGGRSHNEFRKNFVRVEAEPSLNRLRSRHGVHMRMIPVIYNPFREVISAWAMCADSVGEEIEPVEILTSTG